MFLKIKLKLKIIKYWKIVNNSLMIIMEKFNTKRKKIIKNWTFYFFLFYFDSFYIIYFISLRYIYLGNEIIKTKKDGIEINDTIIYPKLISKRQTLLFSATALRAEIATKKSNKDKKWLDKVKIKGIGSGAVKSLPLHLQQLLSVVSVMGDTKVVDVTGAQKLMPLRETEIGGGKKGEKEGKNNEKKNEKENKGKEGDGEGEKEEVWDGSGEGTHDLSTVLIYLIFSLVL